MNFSLRKLHFTGERDEKKWVMAQKDGTRSHRCQLYAAVKRIIFTLQMAVEH